VGHPEIRQVVDDPRRGREVEAGVELEAVGGERVRSQG
jgi:hypothetical protein